MSEAGVAGAVGGVLLAAGAGTRFGGPKALVHFGGERLAERGARLLREGGCAPVCVVLGAAAAQAEAVLRLPGAEVVRNAGWQEGMGSSLRRGLAALQGRCGAAVVALADQPLIAPAAVARLIAAWRGGALAAVATYDDRLRNPVLLDASLWPEVEAHARGDEGARGYLRANAALITAVACDDVARPDDVDTPADLVALAAAAAARPPT